MLFDGCHQFVIGLIGWKLRMIFLICSVLLNRNPALLAWIMPRSLWLSPLAMVWKPIDCNAFTVVYFGILHTHLKTGDFTVVSYLQGITEDGGVTQFFIRGPANCEKVSLIMMTWVMERSSSRNSFAPGWGRSSR